MSGNGITGLVTRATGSWYQVRLTTGHSLSCRMPGKFRLSEEEIVNPLAVGDRVDVRMQSDGTGMIDRIHDRKNRLERKATHGRRGIQILASNVDLVLVVQSLRDPVVKTGFIDRVLVSSEACGISAAIVLNKKDLKKGNKDEKRLE
ncbi:MAG: GTPase RsgA, partial [Bacteroidota bacterium]